MRSWLFFPKQNISSPLFLIASSVLLLCPFLGVVSHFALQQQTLMDLRNRFFTLQENQKQKKSQVKKEQDLFKQITLSDPKYVKNTLESMVFLAKERQKWQLFASQIEPSHPIKERVSFLEQGNNSLQFVQNEIQKNSLFQETEEQQKQAVEMSEEDLKQLLYRVEGEKTNSSSFSPQAPQLLIKSFELEKKTIPGIKEKTYQVQMQLIKREPLVKE